MTGSNEWLRTLILCVTFIVVIWLFKDIAQAILVIAEAAAKNCNIG